MTLKEKIEKRIIELEGELDYVEHNELFLPLSTQDELLDAKIKLLREVLDE